MLVSIESVVNSAGSGNASNSY